jgi:DNA-binding FrmR family transcriptional regulator
MNKQVVIAGLLSAIAAEAEDPTPCEDFVTRAAAEDLASAEVTLAAWEGKIEGLEGAVETSESARDTAKLAYEAVTAAIVPFY